MKLGITNITILFIGCLQLGYGQQLNLEQLKKEVIKNNFTIKNASLEVSKAQHLKKQAFYNHLPKANASLMAVKARNPLLELEIEGGNLPVYDGNPANLPAATQFAYFPGVNLPLLDQFGLGAFNLTQTLYAGNKVNNGNKLASLNLEVQEEELGLVQKKVLLDAEEAFWRVVTLTEKLKTLTSYEAFLTELRTEVETAFNNGLAIRNDVLKVTIKQSELKVKRVQLENGIVLATKKLCQISGVPYSDTLSLRGELDTLQPERSASIDQHKALLQRGEYRLLEKSVKAAELQTRMEKGNMLPTLAIGLSTFYADGIAPGSDGDFNGFGFVGLSIPISNIWENRAKVKQKKLQHAITENTMEDNLVLLQLQMDQAWDKLTETEDLIWLMGETLEQTRENLRVTQDGYDNGLEALSELLEAQAMFNEAEERMIEAKSDYKMALNRYRFVTGR